MRKSAIVVFVLMMFLMAAGCWNDAPKAHAPVATAEDTETASLSISPGEMSLPMQWVSRLKASVTLSSGYTEEITEYTRWESSDESIAIIGSEPETKGDIRGVSPGMAVITARFNDLTATVRIRVTQDNKASLGDSSKIVFLHQHVGGSVWNSGVPEWFADYNARHGKSYSATGQTFPGSASYGWSNNPYDYWNIWVRHAGAPSYRDEPTLETLTKDYNVIVWKHSFGVCSIGTGGPRVQPSDRTMNNYRLQYKALKNKLRSFPKTRFIVWTGAAIAQGAATGDQASLAREFFEWVRNEWDEPGDNIYIWDFFELQTRGEIFLKDEYCLKPGDSNLNPAFSQWVAPYFCKRVVDVIEGRGDSGSVLGK